MAEIKIREPQTPPIDKQAIKEGEEYAEIKRGAKIKNSLNSVFIVLIWVAFTGFLLVFAIRVLHLVLPTEWQWLCEAQIQSIDKLLYSGAIGGFIGRYFKKYSE